MGEYNTNTSKNPMETEEIKNKRKELKEKGNNLTKHVNMETVMKRPTKS